VRQGSTNLPAWTPGPPQSKWERQSRATRAASGQHHHRFRRRLVSPDVRTAAKVIGLLLGVATLATLTGLIIAGTTIGLALLLIR